MGLLYSINCFFVEGLSYIYARNVPESTESVRFACSMIDESECSLLAAVAVLEVKSLSCGTH